MCDVDFDPCDVFQVTRPVARKAHECGECGLPIKPGRTHVRIGTLSEGHWDTYRAHAECYALADFISKEVCGGHGSILLEGLSEEISNLNYEYGWASADERDDLMALGFEFTLDDDGDPDEAPGYSEVCDWLWDIIKAEYQPAAERAS
jgi:hypothetical protein